MTALDPSTEGIEAQKLISISLGKMAASRVGKGGSSLHKSLLVASVLHRARHVFIEENYHNYHYRGSTISPVPIYAPHVPPPTPCDPTLQDNDENRCATPVQESLQSTTPIDEECAPRMPLSDSSNLQQRAVALKRRRCVSDKETQDAVSSILPKRFRSSCENESPNCPSHDSAAPRDHPTQQQQQQDSPTSTVCAPENMMVPIPLSNENFMTPTSPVCASSTWSSSVCPPGESALPEGARDMSITNPIYCTLEPISDDEEEDDDDDSNSMEVEHITSLVSIFSFGGPRKDLCATQAAREDHAQFTPLALAV